MHIDRVVWSLDLNAMKKAAENSGFCLHSFDAQLKEGKLFFSKFQKEVDGSGECVIPLYVEGKYHYDIFSGKYRLPNNKKA
jgi:hypothetical protein